MCELCNNIVNAIDDDEQRHAIERRDEINALIIERFNAMRELFCDDDNNDNNDDEILSSLLH
jgi:hypothetical protein